MEKDRCGQEGTFWAVVEVSEGCSTDKAVHRLCCPKIRTWSNSKSQSNAGRVF